MESIAKILATGVSVLSFNNISIDDLVDDIKENIAEYIVAMSVFTCSSMNLKINLLLIDPNSIMGVTIISIIKGIISILCAAASAAVVFKVNKLLKRKK